MRLRNKKTGEIVELYGWEDFIAKAKSLAELNEDWEPSKTTKYQDIINLLRSENAYLVGKIEAYEKFFKERGYIKEQ